MNLSWESHERRQQQVTLVLLVGADAIFTQATDFDTSYPTREIPQSTIALKRAGRPPSSRPYKTASFLLSMLRDRLVQSCRLFSSIGILIRGLCASGGLNNVLHFALNCNRVTGGRPAGLKLRQQEIVVFLHRKHATDCHNETEK